VRSPFRRTLLCGLASLAVLTGAAVRAADPAPAPADPKAKQMLDDVIKAYKGLSSYSDEGQFVLQLIDNGKSRDQSAPLRMSFSRPNRVDLDTGLVRLVSDGKTITTAVAPMKQYMEAPAPKAIEFETFRQGPIGSVLFGGPTGPPMLILLNMLVADDPSKVIAELDGTLKLGAGGGSIVVDRSEGPDLELFVDPETKLLKSIRLLIDPKLLAQSEAAGRKVEIGKFGWEAGKLSTAAAKDGSFAFAAPKDFKKVESFAGAGGPGGEPGEAVKKLVGKPSPEFTLTVLDGAKTRTLSKADLAGKVVMLDFWATWCGPCIKELPEVQKMIEAYDKDKKDVLIVALSQDSDPKDLEGVRKLVEKTLEEKKVVLTGTKVGLVALDPSNSIGNAFSVEAIPTLVILDGKGIVQAVHVGGQTSETLSKDIDTLLAGKSLATPKPEEAATRKD